MEKLGVLRKPAASLLVALFICGASFIIYGPLCMWGCPDTLLPKFLGLIFWGSAIASAGSVLWLLYIAFNKLKAVE
jgi:hypothetical protein